MKQKNNYSTRLLGAALIVSCVFYGCTGNDESGKTETVQTEPPVETVIDSPATAMQTDVPKPNPQKKGLKGKASATPEMPAKADAKMQPDESGYYPIVNVMASFPNGTTGLQNYFDKNLEYPEEAVNNGVEGVVRISFVVDEKGKLKSPEVTSATAGYGLEAEALRVVNMMPAWKPALVNGKSVKTKITLPISFVLN